MSLLVMKKIEVTTVRGRGRGVVARERIGRGARIEVSPVLVLTDREVKGVIQSYVYEFGRTKFALAFGMGSLFNHSKFPNMYITKSIPKRQLTFWARRVIRPGEELTFDYGYVPTGYDGE